MRTINCKFIVPRADTRSTVRGHGTARLYSYGDRGNETKLGLVYGERNANCLRRGPGNEQELIFTSWTLSVRAEFRRGALEPDPKGLFGTDVRNPAWQLVKQNLTDLDATGFDHFHDLL
jgi:hypothetical protein